VLKVLIAEDDLMIADLAEEVLVEGGYEVCGIARTVAEAVALAQHHKPDLAILDLRLADGGLGTEIAALLRPLGRLGVLYATGNASQVVLTTADGDACLSKPYRSIDLLRALEIVAGHGQGVPALSKWLPSFAPGDGPSGGGGMNDDGAKVRKLLRQQAAVARFGSFAFREGDLLTALTEAARVCAESLDVPYAKVCRYRAMENDLLIEAGHGWKAGVIGTIESADPSSPQGRAFVTGEPSIYKDVRTDSNFELPGFYAAHGIVSTVDVVIHAKDDATPYGVLEIDNDQQHDYDRHARYGRFGSPGTRRLCQLLSNPIRLPPAKRQPKTCPGFSGVRSHHHKVDPAILEAFARKAIPSHFLNPVPVLEEITGSFVLRLKFRLQATSVARITVRDLKKDRLPSVFEVRFWRGMTHVLFLCERLTGQLFGGCTSDTRFVRPYCDAARTMPGERRCRRHRTDGYFGLGQFGLLIQKRLITLAGQRFQNVSVEYFDHAARIADRPGVLDPACDLRDRRATDAEHFSEKFLRQSNRIARSAIGGLKQPPAKTGLDEMQGVARGGDTRLRQQHLIEVDAEIANGVALVRGLPEMRGGNFRCSKRELNKDPH
jgi:CheY-like chemotaxis protein